MQYHVEIEPDTVDNWAAVPAYRQALMESIGTAGYQKMAGDADANMADMTRAAEKLYDNFMAQL